MDGRYFRAPVSDETAYVLEIDLGQTRSFNLVEIREPIGSTDAGFT